MYMLCITINQYTISNIYSVKAKQTEWCYFTSLPISSAGAQAEGSLKVYWQRQARPELLMNMLMTMC